MFSMLTSMSFNATYIIKNGSILIHLTIAVHLSVVHTVVEGLLVSESPLPPPAPLLACCSLLCSIPDSWSNLKWKQNVNGVGVEGGGSGG